MATVQKRGDTYIITVSCGYDIHGKQVRRHRTWEPEPGMTAKQIQKTLQREQVLFEEDCKTGVSEGGSIKFEAFAKQWFEEYAEPSLKTRTVSRYHQLEERTYAALGHLRMDRIKVLTSAPASRWHQRQSSIIFPWCQACLPMPYRKASSKTTHAEA